MDVFFTNMISVLLVVCKKTRVTVKEVYTHLHPFVPLRCVIIGINILRWFAFALKKNSEVDKQFIFLPSLGLPNTAISISRKNCKSLSEFSLTL